MVELWFLFVQRILSKKSFSRKVQRIKRSRATPPPFMSDNEYFNFNSKLKLNIKGLISREEGPFRSNV